MVFFWFRVGRKTQGLLERIISVGMFHELSLSPSLIFVESCKTQPSNILEPSYSRSGKRQFFVEILKVLRKLEKHLE